MLMIFQAQSFPALKQFLAVESNQIGTALRVDAPRSPVGYTHAAFLQVTEDCRTLNDVYCHDCRALRTPYADCSSNRRFPRLCFPTTVIIERSICNLAQPLGEALTVGNGRDTPDAPYTANVRMKIVTCAPPSRPPARRKLYLRNHPG